MRTSTFIFTAITLLLLASCGSDSTATEAEAPEAETNRVFLTHAQFKTGEMEFGTCSTQPFNGIIKTTGRLDVPPEYKSTVSAYFGGYVKQISLLEGQRVTQGQTLFTLENPDYIQTQQDFLEAKSVLAYLKMDYERQKDLSRDNVSSQKTFSKAESDYKVTLARYESLKRRLQLMNINPASVTESNLKSTIAVTAPISGYVTSVLATKGMFLNPSDVAVTIMNSEHLHVELAIFEQDLRRVSVGQNVTFTLQNDRTNYDATVHLINKAIHMEKRTINVHCHITNEKQSSFFTPGMYLEAEIYATKDSALALPISAVVTLNDKSYVLVKTNKTSKGYELTKKEVKRGQTSATHIEILDSELNKPGTEILIQGAFNLISE